MALPELACHVCNWKKDKGQRTKDKGQRCVLSREEGMGWDPVTMALWTLLCLQT